MDDSARLRAEVARRASARMPERAPITQVIEQLAIRDAHRRGTDPADLLAKMRDPEEGDRLLEEAERRINLERATRQADIMLARLPFEYRAANFPKTDFGREAHRWLTDYRAARAARRTPRSLVILGGTGTGKTWTACAIARALLVEDVIPTTVITVGEMLDSMRPASGGLDVDMIQFATAPVLVLDDLGAERPTEWASEQLYRLSHARSHNGRPTIVTSNLTGKEIRERYDERTVERLFGGAQLIQIAGKSRRELPF